jgi:hypothetical protein
MGSTSKLIRVLFPGLWLAAILGAQVNSGTILGTVTDPTGAVVAGARVTALNELTGFSRVATADAEGSYLLPLLPVSDSYRITVEGGGFKSAVRSRIALQVGQNLRVDFQLQLGNITEKVEVTAAATLVDTRSSAGGEVVERARIVELPLSGRNALQLATLLPGVSVASIRTTIDGGNRAGNSLDVSGSRSNEIDWQIDGVHFAGSYTNSGMNMPSPDALQEFKLVTNAYSAEFGLFSGAVLRAVLRSGTNQFHGSLWEFLRNNHLNARNFFLPYRVTTEAEPVRRRRRIADYQEPPVSLLQLPGTSSSDADPGPSTHPAY